MKTELFKSGVKEIKRSFRFIHTEFVVQWNYITKMGRVTGLNPYKMQIVTERKHSVFKVLNFKFSTSATSSCPTANQL